MEYENGALEYLADIKKQPYVRLLRDKSTEIKGVSVEANYLHNQCNKCGARFYTEEDFHAHMANEHFIKTDPTSEPHGILGQALSLVLSPEEPGYPDTTTELMETYRKPVLQLLEIVTKTKKEKINYMNKLEGKATLTPQSRKTVDVLKEQTEGDQPPAHPTEEPEGGCDPGFHKDPETGECVADEIPAEPEKVIEQEEGLCPPGFHDDGAGGCAADPIPEVEPPTNAPQITPEPVIEIPKVDVAIPAPTEQPPLDVTQTLGEQAEDNIQPVPHPVEAGGKECPIEGTHWDELAGTCVPDVIIEDPTGAVEPPATKVFTELKLPKLLSLGEPVDEHGCHHDEAWDGEKCVKKEPVSETMNIYEAVKRLDHRALIRDVKIAEAVNKENRAIAQIANVIKTLPRNIQKQLLMESKLRASYDANQTRQINKALKKIVGAINSLNKQGTSNLEKSNKDIVEQVNKGLKNLAESINKQSTFTTTKLNQLATANAKQARKVAQQNKDYESILNAVDEKYKQVNKENKTLKQRVKEQEDELKKHDCGEGKHYDKEKDECVDDAPKEEPAAEEIKKLKETYDARIDNLEAKITGKFKGVSKSTEKSTDEVVKDPLKKKRRTKNA